MSEEEIIYIILFGVLPPGENIARWEVERERHEGEIAAKIHEAMMRQEKKTAEKPQAIEKPRKKQGLTI